MYVYYVYICEHKCLCKDWMLVNKAAMAAWVMAIVTPVVAMAASVECTITPE